MNKLNVIQTVTEAFDFILALFGTSYPLDMEHGAIFGPVSGCWSGEGYGGFFDRNIYGNQ